MATSKSPFWKALLGPLPGRWRPFGGFVGGVLILAVLAIFGRYGGEAWRFFVMYTFVTLVFGAAVALYQARTARRVRS